MRVSARRPAAAARSCKRPRSFSISFSSFALPPPPPPPPPPPAAAASAVRSFADCRTPPPPPPPPPRRARQFEPHSLSARYLFGFVYLCVTLTMIILTAAVAVYRLSPPL